MHRTAVVGADVQLAQDVEVGPFCYLDGAIHIGAGTTLLSHVTILGHAEIGRGNVFHPNSVIGGAPQDVSYTGGVRRVCIGHRNGFREGVTVHRGSEHGDATIIGSDNLFMVNSHVAHDCQIGDRVVLVNGALLGGWVQIGNAAIISGNCVIHQFCRVGRLAMMRGLSRTSRDIPPFCIADGLHLLRGVNVVGLRRAGFSAETVRAIRRAFVILFGRARNLNLALDELIATGPLVPEVHEMLDFIASSKRGVVQGPRSLPTANRASG
ncbi:MAG TPA: acyl-ACP--UDP-N-acetylglucosamine O-acyltransferase [Candidatus Binataceae bacterium]